MTNSFVHFQPNIGNSVELPKPLPASMIDTSILRDDANGDKDDESNVRGSFSILICHLNCINISF